jgi:hypothetical protein
MPRMVQATDFLPTLENPLTDTLTHPAGHAPSSIDELDPDFIAGTAIFEAPDAVYAAPADAPKAVRRFNLIDPNQHWFIVLCLVLFGAILAASLLWSFNAIVAMSDWMAPTAQLRWLPAVFLDLAIIGYSFSLAVFKSRGAAGLRKIWLTRLGLVVSTSFSVVANATHTLDFWHGNLSTYQAVIGIIFSAVIPLLALMATEEIVRLAFVDPDQETPRKPRFRFNK